MLDYKKTGLKFLGFILVCIVVILSIALGLYFWPFLIGILVAVAVERIVNYFVVKFKLSRKVIGTILVVLVYIIIGALLSLIITALVKEAIGISSNIPRLYEESKIEYNAIYKTITDIMDKTPSAITESLYDFGLKMISKLSEIITSIVNNVIDFIMFFPNIMIYIIITFLATLF